MGAMQRRKGQVAENELCCLLREELGDEVSHEIKRALGQERDGGCDIPVECFAIQVKRHETGFQTAWWGQALNDADKLRKVPVVAYRKSRKGWQFRFPADALYGEDYTQRTLDHTVETGIAGFAFVVREVIKYQRKCGADNGGT